ncbi:MAG: hypothetical protein JW862_12005 [Anaerolineales bacterium]|nr:hypothetical protein [Anaerolineales bacterium]
MNQTRLPHRSVRRLLWLAGAALILSILACTYTDRELEIWAPENPRQYTAQVQQVFEVVVLVDSAGNMVDFGSDAPFEAVAEMRYELRFWDAGDIVDGYGSAAIYRLYKPTSILTIYDDENYSEAEEAAIYGRTDFTSREIKVHDLEFTGGPTGIFMGVNSVTGEQIEGSMVWREDVQEMHVVFTRGIQQDYLVLGQDVFGNWP